jgi:hypothetical protein
MTMDVKVVADYEVLASFVYHWDDLAEHAVEPNPFYESWMLLPALRNYGSGKDLRFLMVFGETGNSLLCAVFPLVRAHRFMGLPVSTWTMWKYDHCPLTTPLIRKGYEREALKVLFEWLGSGEGECDLLELKHVAADGPFQQALVDRLHVIGSVPIVGELFTRALFRPEINAEQYFTRVMSAKSRSVFRRKSKLIAELGTVEFTTLQPADNIDGWIESFLRIERSGWKGREGSALACKDSHRNFLLEAGTEAFRRKRLLMPAMLLNGKAIAQHCYFLSGHGSFFFKPAFDETYARFSPGLQLECETIRQLHETPYVKWMDSCTSPDNDMYNRLFLSRRTIETLLIPLGKRSRAIVVSAIPLLKAVKRNALKYFGRRSPEVHVEKPQAAEV